eukprot:9357913-Pyramimonas_sp.AAC.1
MPSSGAWTQTVGVRTKCVLGVPATGTLPPWIARRSTWLRAPAYQKVPPSTPPEEDRQASCLDQGSVD